MWRYENINIEISEKTEKGGQSTAALLYSC